MRLVVSICLLFLINLTVFSQNFLGVNQSNYSGITRFELQPASIADNRLKFDMNLLGTSVGFYNNFLSMKAGSMRQMIFEETDSAFWDNNVSQNYNGDSKSIYMNWDIQLPSFMITLSDKAAMAFTSKWRTFVNIDGVEEDMARLIVNDFDYPALHNQTLTNERFSIQSMMWAEYGVGYARVVMDKEKHFLKAGGRVKLLQGIQGAHMFVENLQYNFSNADSADVFNSEVTYGHSSNFDPSTGKFTYELGSKLGVGLDLGLVYEFRPKWRDYKYDMDGRDNLWKKYPNKYKLRVGVSAIDIGRIKFEKGARSGNFTADINNWHIREILEDSTFSMKELNDTLFSLFARSPGDEDFFLMNLPTAFNIEADYNIWKDFYIGTNAYIALQFLQDKNKVHAVSNFSVIPRWDWRYLGVSAPMSYSRYAGGFRTGLGVHVGPIFIGTTDIRSVFSKSDLYGGDVYVAAKIAIYNRDPKDKDGDQVSDKFDDCPDIAGVWTFKGCPDSDNDLIPDTEDECPAEHGLLEFGGCPDSDRDGIKDSEDECPMVFGVDSLGGCPDTDRDGIKDSEDECPELFGLAKFNGCPDSDNDGVIDSEDNCPTEPGPERNFGCPERIRVHLVDPMGNIIATAVMGENGKFIFRNLPLNATYLFLLDGFDENDKEDLELVIRNEDGDHDIKAVLEKSGFFVYRHLESTETTLDLMEAGASAVLIGVGPGAACTTRGVLGFKGV